MPRSRSLRWLHALRRKMRQQSVGKPIVALHPVKGVRFFQGGFCTSEVSRGYWKFFDGLETFGSHLALWDWKDRPVAVLTYHDANFRDSYALQRRNAFTIYSIQREYPTIKFSERRRRAPTYAEYDSAVASSARARRVLGIHSSDFLMHDFLERHRREILAGKKVRLELPRMEQFPFGNVEKELYGPLIDRYFKKKPVSFSLDTGDNEVARSCYELSFDKRRVREALGLPPEKRKS